MTTSASSYNTTAHDYNCLPQGRSVVILLKDHAVWIYLVVTRLHYSQWLLLLVLDYSQWLLLLVPLATPANAWLQSQCLVLLVLDYSQLVQLPMFDYSYVVDAILYQFATIASSYTTFSACSTVFMHSLLITTSAWIYSVVTAITNGWLHTQWLLIHHAVLDWL